MSATVTGREFEALLVFRAQKLEAQGVLTLCRYGVQARMMKNEATGKMEWQVIPSLPDFDACIAPSGRQLIIEAKVCSQASYPIASTGKKRPKQIEHMLLRAKFGALCYLLLHFNPRSLKTREDEARTFAIPVHPDLHFWREYDSCERLTLSRSDADLYGLAVPWNEWSPRASKLTPDLSYLLPGKTTPQLL
jgi:hypothetical protein